MADRSDPDIALTAFDTSDIVPMEAGPGGQLLLRDPDLLSEFSDAPPDDDAQVSGHDSDGDPLNTIGLHTIVFTMPVSTIERGTEQIECPLCGGQGIVRARSSRHERPVRYGCGLCGGAGSVTRDQLEELPRLRAQMQRVADLIQGGNADGAADASRVAFRIALSIIVSAK